MNGNLTDRILEEEVIDHVDASEPHALRSRRDLRIIDALLGNSRWIERAIRTLKVDSIVELGAGDGHLSRKLSRIYPQARITGLDLVQTPNDWKHPLHWIQGDLLKTIGETSAQICIGSLVLHHFDREELTELGNHLQRFSMLVFSEPHRHVQPLTGSYLLRPFMGKIVRHDMPASIRAGFKKGEIPEFLKLDHKSWSIQESVNILGALRFTARRLQD
jgi:2-polyprenyl-3-methyl-5-hydroxy-6-metoxy-1,4-benzoquinol methylase